MLTRIKKQWLVEKEEVPECCLGIGELEELHGVHHMERMLYLVWKVDPHIKREEVQKVVKNCIRCQSINTAPNIHDPGEIGTSKNGTRLAIDITHYHGGAYLSMIDCGLGRLVIWRELHAESPSAVAEEFEKVMLEHGPVIEVIMYNGTVFCSEIFQMMLKKMKDKKLLQGSL